MKPVRSKATLFPKPSLAQPRPRSYQLPAKTRATRVMILRSILAVIAFLAVGSLSFFAAHQTRLVWFDAAAAVEAAASYDATIVRDRYGVPHISGQRDADVAFGLAFAHAQDD